MKFLIQKFNEESLQVNEAAKNLGIETILADLSYIYCDDFEVEPMAINGSVSSVEHLQTKHNILTLSPWKALKPSVYQAYWGEKCFNYEGIFLPAAEVVRRWDELVKSFSGDLFVKPDSVKKDFEAEVYENSQMLAHFIEYGQINATTMCQVAPSYKIYKEARMFVLNGKVITGSYYKEYGKLHKELCQDQNLIGFVESLPTYPGLPSLYTVDVAVCDLGSAYSYYVLELSSVNCCGWYEGDKPTIIKAIMAETQMLYKLKENSLI